MPERALISPTSSETVLNISFNLGDGIDLMDGNLSDLDHQEKD